MTYSKCGVEEHLNIKPNKPHDNRMRWTAYTEAQGVLVKRAKLFFAEV
jgi:hypothetical protein